MLHKVNVGKKTRMSFSRINEILDMPDLIEVQKDSYRQFIEKGLGEVLDDISPIKDFSERLVLEFVGYKIDESKPKRSVAECKERDVNYCAPLYVIARLINTETGSVKQQEVFMGDFPLMTEQGTFVINGAERVIVSQLVRSPGAYYTETVDKVGRRLFNSQVHGLNTKPTATKFFTQKSTVSASSTSPPSCALSVTAPMRRSLSCSARKNALKTPLKRTPLTTRLRVLSKYTNASVRANRPPKRVRATL